MPPCPTLCILLLYRRQFSFDYFCISPQITAITQDAGKSRDGAKWRLTHGLPTPGGRRRCGLWLYSVRFPVTDTAFRISVLDTDKRDVGVERDLKGHWIQLSHFIIEETKIQRGETIIPVTEGGLALFWRLGHWIPAIRTKGSFAFALWSFSGTKGQRLIGEKTYKFIMCKEANS